MAHVEEKSWGNVVCTCKGSRGLSMLTLHGQLQPWLTEWPRVRDVLAVHVKRACRFCFEAHLLLCVNCHISFIISFGQLKEEREISVSLLQTPPTQDGLRLGLLW